MPLADWWSILQNEVQQDSYKDLLERSPSQSRHQFVQRDGVWQMQ